METNRFLLIFGILCFITFEITLSEHTTNGNEKLPINDRVRYLQDQINFLQSRLAHLVEMTNRTTTTTTNDYYYDVTTTQSPTTKKTLPPHPQTTTTIDYYYDVTTTRSPTTRQTPPPPPRYHSRQYMGCYTDMANPRAMANFNLPAHTNTVDACMNNCKMHGYTFSGTEYGYECFCSQNLPNTAIHPKREDSKCNTRCRGDRSQICGGHWGISIYATGHN